MKTFSLKTLTWALLLITGSVAAGAERAEPFDQDPGWDAHNNRSAPAEGRTVRQDFGYSATAHGGSIKGEIGGFIQPAAEPAYYAKPIAARTMGNALSASGKLVCEGRQFHALIGFFKAETVNEWRTPNTIALRVYGRGDVFYAYIEYANRKWRAGGVDFGAYEPVEGKRMTKPFRSGSNAHLWSLEYDPAGNQGSGTVIGMLDEETVVLNLDPGHKSDGANFNRFGLLNVMKHYDTGGELWLDDLVINGERESFDQDPHWNSFQNRRSYVSHEVRPCFNFGYSPSHFAGGSRTGEMGGLIFRGDGRHEDRMAFYGDRLNLLTLHQPIRASGKVSLRRAVSDSDILIGFFHSAHSLNSGGSDAISTPPDFLGIRIGGPSREGFFFAPVYRLHGRKEKSGGAGPYVYPDGASHAWSLEYEPQGAEGRGRMIVRLGGDAVTLDLEPGDQAMDAHLDRFGLITTHTDGNGQQIYFDDLTYTWSQTKGR